MALNWDITKCNNMEALQSDTEWPVTNAVIWSTLAVEIGDLTEKTVNEFYARVKLWETVNGALTYTKDGADYFITLEDLRKRIGLSTNVSNLPRGKWLKRIERIIAENQWKTTPQLSLNEINAIIFQAHVEAEKETVNA